MSNQEQIFQQLSDLIHKNYFELFNIPVAFHINKNELAKVYRELQTIAHPDRFVHESNQAERLAIQATTHINTAYNTLKSDVERSIYILNLNSINVLDAKNTQICSDFLEEQLEWREKIAEAKLSRDIGVAENILDLVHCKMKNLIEQIQACLDHSLNYSHAEELVRQLIFITKLSDEIENLISELEDD